MSNENLKNVMEFSNDAPIETIVKFLRDAKRAGNLVIVLYNGYKFNSLTTTEEEIYKKVYNMSKLEYLMNYYNNNPDKKR